MKKAAFISYRRSDTAWVAGRIRDRLDRIFPGRVFMDVSDIGAGEDFVRAIRDTLAQCSVVIAVIGEKWREPGMGRRLGDPDDYVALELVMALERGLPIFPLLVGGVTMPGEAELPEELKPLAQRNALEIRQTRFEQDLAEFLGELHRTMNLEPAGRLETWAAMLSGQQQFNEFQRGLYAALCGLCGSIGLLAGVAAEDEPAAVPMLLLFTGLLWPFGRRSFKLGWVAHLGAAAALCGLAVAVARSAL